MLNSKQWICKNLKCDHRGRYKEVVQIQPKCMICKQPMVLDFEWNNKKKGKSKQGLTI